MRGMHEMEPRNVEEDSWGSGNYEWKIEEAIDLLRSIQPDVREAGYHVCLGGGVLNNGSSTKDLDILAMYSSLKEQDRMSLLNIFTSKGFAYIGSKNKFEGIEVCKLENGNKKVDLIIVQRNPSVITNENFSGESSCQNVVL